MPCCFSSSDEKNVVDSECFPCHLWVNIKYEIYAFFGSEIYAYVNNGHGLKLIPSSATTTSATTTEEDKHVVSGLWFMNPYKSDFMKPIHFIVEYFSPLPKKRGFHVWGIVHFKYFSGTLESEPIFILEYDDGKNWNGKSGLRVRKKLVVEAHNNIMSEKKENNLFP